MEFYHRLQVHQFNYHVIISIINLVIPESTEKNQSQLGTS